METVSPGVVLQRGVPDRGPKAGHAVPGSRSAGRVGSRHLTLVDGVLPMFDRHPSCSGWIVGQRDVAGGEDILDGGSLVFVDGDPAPDRRDARRFGQSRSGCDTDRGEHQVAVERDTVVQTNLSVAQTSHRDSPGVGHARIRQQVNDAVTDIGTQPDGLRH